MSDLTLQEAQALLSKVNIAIESKVQNRRFSELRVGTNEYMRIYSYDTTTMDELLTLRRELLAIIHSYDIPAAPVFRQNACIPIVVRKGEY